MRHKWGTSKKCAFCKSTDIRSGSWSPETCQQCGAAWMMGVWESDTSGWFVSIVDWIINLFKKSKP